MRKKRGLKILVLRAALVILALVMLLPMVQTFLYSFSSPLHRTAPGRAPGSRLAFSV